MNRTNKQNSALHLYFQLLADELNGAGYSVMKTLRHDIDIDWSPALIKELIWRKVQEAQLGKKSTTDLTSKEIDEIYETINRYVSEKFGITVLFPNEDDKYYKTNIKI